MTAAGMPIDALAQRCAEETERFTRHQAHDDQFCFELLRRALADGVMEAFTRVYQIYERQVLIWVYRHTKFAWTGESAEYFAAAALRNFYFALRGAHFEHFTTLPALLQYLKLCVHTAITQHLRDEPPATLPLDAAAELSSHEDPDGALAAAAIWARISVLLLDPHDRLLARCVIVQGLRPREIMLAFPGQWRDERTITVAVYRIRTVLRRDPELRRLYGLDDNPSPS